MQISEQKARREGIQGKGGRRRGDRVDGESRVGPSLALFDYGDLTADNADKGNAFVLPNYPRPPRLDPLAFHVEASNKSQPTSSTANATTNAGP